MVTLETNQTVQIVAGGPIAEITINRPESLNALNIDILGSLLRSFEELASDPSVRVVIVSSVGEKAFVAGADIATMSQLGPRAAADYIELGQRVMRRIEQFPAPVIAAVQGFALGGGMELALAADLVIASPQAKFGQPEVNLGIIPGFGGTARLLVRCGVGVARRLVLTGDIISAAEAHSLGIVDIVAPEGELREEVARVSQRIAAKGPLAVAAAKRVLRESVEATLLPGLRREVEAFLSLFATADREEGMGAFLQKRSATFVGR